MYNLHVTAINCTLEKTSRGFKIWYNEHISEINCKKSFSKYNFAKHVLEYNPTIRFDK